jgi:hypothetical protein
MPSERTKVEKRMKNQTQAIKRKSSARKSTTGIKAFMMVASIVMTIGGWGILALGQAQDALAAAQPAIVQPASAVTQNGVNTLRPSTTLRQSTQSSAIARTRSSR